MLQKNSRHDDDDDIACNVTFTLAGPIRTFGSADLPKVVDREHLAAVHDVDSNAAGDFHVKLVKAIEFCRPGLPPRLSFEGCSYSPPHFRSMIFLFTPNCILSPITLTICYCRTSLGTWRAWGIDLKATKTRL